MKKEKLIRVLEYAKIKGISKQAVYKQMKNKQVKFKKIAGFNFIVID